MLCPRCGTIAVARSANCGRCGGSLAPVDKTSAPEPPVPRAPTRRGELAQEAAGVVPKILAKPGPPRATSQPAYAAVIEAPPQPVTPQGGGEQQAQPAATFEDAPASTPAPPPQWAPPSADDRPGEAAPPPHWGPPNGARPRDAAGPPPGAWPPPPATWEPRPTSPPPPGTDPVNSTATLDPAHDNWSRPPSWPQTPHRGWGGRPSQEWRPEQQAPSQARQRAEAWFARNFAKSTTSGTPPTYLWQSVACLLLFLPSAIVAIVYSTRVTRRAQDGDMTGAVRASRLARTWCLLSLLAFTVAVVWTAAGAGVS